MTQPAPTAPVSPPAVRLRRPGWRDPRLLVGLVLVAASVALGSAAVAGAGRTVPVLAAREALVPGAALDDDAVLVREVRLAEAGDLYVRADAPRDRLVVTRTVGAGELVPAAAVAPAAALDVRTVAITPREALSAEVRRGAGVDLWFVPDPGRGTGAGAAGSGPAAVAAATPTMLAADVTVAEVSQSRTALSVAGGTTVQVLVPLDLLPDVLAALATDGSVEVVPVAGAVP
jgi:hypothetical protein